MLEIYEMQIFLAAAETGSFSEAGRRLQMSQPAVSMQIRSLEKRLDVELFHRSGRHIRLTELGQALIPMARDLVNHATRLEEEIASMKGDVIGVLQIACSTTAGKYVLPRLIGGFLEEYPSVQVVCRVGSRGSALEKLLEGEAHLAVTSLCEPSKEVEYRSFKTDPVVLIVPPDHQWADREFIEVTELSEGKFIRREITSGTQQTVVQALSEHDIGLDDLPTVMILGNSEAIHEAVAERIGAGFISRCAATDGIQYGRVIEVPIKGLQMAQQLHMVRRANRTATSAQAAFWDYVYAPANSHLLNGHALETINK